MPRSPREGERAPEFEAADEDGRVHGLADYRGRWLVLFFYPRDETPGCVAESCAFRDRYEDLLATGADVLGVSRDSAVSHRAFRARRRLAYHLLADEDGRMSAAFGAVGLLGLPKRITFLIDPDGVVRAVHDSHLSPEGHVDEMLARLTALAGPRRPG